MPLRREERVGGVGEAPNMALKRAPQRATASLGGASNDVQATRTPEHLSTLCWRGRMAHAEGRLRGGRVRGGSGLGLGGARELLRTFCRAMESVCASVHDVSMCGSIRWIVRAWAS